MKGFTLIELLVVLAIMGIISAVAIPMYNDYLDSSKITTVQNNLRSVYLQQQDYFVNNNAYYTTGVVCGDNVAAINTNLFSGTQVMDNSLGFTYCITQTTIADFTAQAVEEVGSRTFTINNLNVNNF